MMQCQCSGIIHTYYLSNKRQVWNCNSCGRREEFIQNTETTPNWLTEKEKDELWLNAKLNGQCLNIDVAMALIDAVEDIVIAKNRTDRAMR